MDKKEQKPKKKSGSETRQATKRLTLRFTPDQRHQLDELANAAGSSCSSYVLAKLFAGQPIRAVRRPPIERQALAKFLAQLGRLNGNVYQISRAANFGEPYEVRDLADALREITEMRNVVLAALGRGEAV
jgi:uncharacterized protein (DUF1778 family)